LWSVTTSAIRHAAIGASKNAAADYQKPEAFQNESLCFVLFCKLGDIQKLLDLIGTNEVSELQIHQTHYYVNPRRRHWTGDRRGGGSRY